MLLWCLNATILICFFIVLCGYPKKRISYIIHMFLISCGYPFISGSRMMFSDIWFRNMQGVNAMTSKNKCRNPNGQVMGMFNNRTGSLSNKHGSTQAGASSRHGSAIKNLARGSCKNDGKMVSDVTMQHYAPMNFLDDILSQCLEDFIHWVSFAQDPPHC